VTSFGLTACSAIYYQVPHCRFLIKHAFLWPLHAVSVNPSWAPRVNSSTLPDYMYVVCSSLGLNELKHNLLRFPASSAIDCRLLNSTTYYETNVKKYCYMVKMNKFPIHSLGFEKICAGDVVCSNQCRLLNLITYSKINLKKYFSDG
jgi:hypothetical protein